MFRPSEATGGAQPSELAFLRADADRYRQNGKLKWYEPSFWSVCEYRFRRWGDAVRSRHLRRLLWFATSMSYSVLRLLTGIDLPRRARIGPGLRIWHFGGIVVNAETVIGRNCTIRQQVTIGSRHDEHDVPVLGDDVDIGGRRQDSRQDCRRKSRFRRRECGRAQGRSRRPYCGWRSGTSFPQE